MQYPVRLNHESCEFTGRPPPQTAEACTYTPFPLALSASASQQAFLGDHVSQNRVQGAQWMLLERNGLKQHLIQRVVYLTQKNLHGLAMGGSECLQDTRLCCPVFCI